MDSGTNRFPFPQECAVRCFSTARATCSAALCLTVLLATTGCASWRPIEPTPGAVPRTYPEGEVLRLTMGDGQRVELRVSAVTADSLFGSLRFRPDSTLAIARIAVRHTERFQARDGGSIALVVGGVLVLGLVAAIAIVGSGGLPVFSDQ